MKQICNNCGRPMPDGVKYCPNCGQPTPLAPIDAQKKTASTPPPLPPQPTQAQPAQAAAPQQPAQPTSSEPQQQQAQAPQAEAAPSGQQQVPPVTPPPYGGHRPAPSGPQKPQRKNFGCAVAAAVAAVVLILIAIIGYYIKKNTTVTVTRTVSTQSIPLDSLGQADVDSIFQIVMQQSNQQMAMMDSLERAFMGGVDIDEPAPQQGAQQQAQPRQQQKGVIAMTGTIGQQECQLHLNVADPQNVKGSARFILKGKPGIPMKLIGLFTGDGTLTVSIYKGEEIAGTLMGSCDGQSYQGNFTSASGNKEIPFSFSASR